MLPMEESNASLAQVIMTVHRSKSDENQVENLSGLQTKIKATNQLAYKRRLKV